MSLFRFRLHENRTMHATGCTREFAHFFLRKIHCDCYCVQVTSKTKQATTIDALRAIAHPARIRLYELLVQDGSATVSQLATKAQLAIGSASYHLLQLKHVGFVEEVIDPGKDRRQHWWQAVPGGMAWSPADFLDTPAGREISTSAQRMMTERRFRRLIEWNKSWQAWSREWIEAAVETDVMISLTPRELAGMAAEIKNVISRWASSVESTPADESGERRTVFAFLSAFPVDDTEA